jgi:hypothetical protein
MISNGTGIISVPIEKHEKFRNMLIEFYETGNMSAIKEFVYENCIDGLDFSRERQPSPFSGNEKWKEPDNDE